MREDVNNIESMTSYELELLVKPFYSKVETLGKILKIDTTSKDGTRHVLNQAITFYSLWTDSDDDTENKTLKDDCIKLLQELAGDGITDMRDVLALSREIMQELLMKIKSASI